MNESFVMTLKSFAPLAEFKADNEVPLSEHAIFILSSHTIVDPATRGLEKFTRSDHKGVVLQREGEKWLRTILSLEGHSLLVYGLGNIKQASDYFKLIGCQMTTNPDEQTITLSSSQHKRFVFKVENASEYAEWVSKLN